MSMNRTQTNTILGALGWRVNTPARSSQAVKDFQQGWNLGARLTVDGKVGPRTTAALALSETRRRTGKPTASARFSFKDFQCRCAGRYVSCRRIWIDRGQVQRMEAYRTRLGRSVRVVSGCRCDGHNRAVGGAVDSRHRLGTACDVEGLASLATVRSWRIFSGLGYKGSTGRVLHADNRSTGSVSRPTTWRYA